MNRLKLTENEIYADQLTQKLENGKLILAYSEIRQKILELIAQFTHSPITLAKKLADAAALKTVEEREDNEGYLCAQYVFGKIYNEPWALPYRSSEINKEDHQLWRNTSRFLADRSYQRITGSLRTNDIALYGCPTFGPAHFGIIGEKQIISKFGRSNIVAHPIDLVPNSYGSEVSFFPQNRIAQ